MAKPIRSTPTLTNGQAKDFVREMMSMEKRKPNKQEQFLIDVVIANQ